MLDDVDRVNGTIRFNLQKCHWLFVLLWQRRGGWGGNTSACLRCTCENLPHAEEPTNRPVARPYTG